MLNSNMNLYTNAVSFDSMFAERVIESIAAGIRIFFTNNLEIYLKNEQRTKTVFFYSVMPVHHRWVNQNNYLSFLYKAWPEKPPGDEFKIFQYGTQSGWNGVDSRYITVGSEELFNFMYPPQAYQAQQAPPPPPLSSRSHFFAPKTRRFEPYRKEDSHVKIHHNVEEKKGDKGGKEAPISISSSTDDSTVVESLQSADSIQSAAEFERVKKERHDRYLDDEIHKIVAEFIKKCVRCPDRKEFLIHNVISIKMIYLAFLGWKNDYVDVLDISEKDFANHFWGLASSMKIELPFFEEYKETIRGRPVLLVNRKVRGIHLVVNGVRFPEKHWQKREVANELLRPISKKYTAKKHKETTYLKEVMFPKKREREEEEEEEEEGEESSSSSSSNFSRLSSSSESSQD